MANMVAESASPSPLEKHRNSVSTSSPKTHGNGNSSSTKSAKFSNGEEIQRDSQSQQRRPKTREVSSRYMFPTFSSAAAAAANSPNNDGSPHGRRSSSPTGKSLSRSRNNSFETPVIINNNNNNSSRSVSVERRRISKGEENGQSVRHRATTALWPSANTAIPTLADQLSNETVKKKTENDHRAFSSKDVHSNVEQSFRNSDKVLGSSGTSSRTRTPDRQRISPRPSVDVENTKPAKENVQNGVLNATKGYAAPLKKNIEAMNNLKVVNRTGSLNLPGRSSRFSELRPSGGSVNFENVPGFITPGRFSVDLDRQTRKASQRNYNYQEDGEAEVSSANSIVSDGGGSSTPGRVVGEEGEENGKSLKKTSKKAMRGSYVPARFLQDTLSRIRRLSETGHNNNNHQEGYNNRETRSLSFGGNSMNGSSVSSWSMSPGRGPVMASMPGVSNSTGVRGKNFQSVGSSPKSPKLASSSGSRMSNMLNFGIELLTKGKKSALQSAAQEEVLHQLRLLQNRLLQWRFINARAQAAHQAQITSAQNSIYSVWLKTKELRRSVAIKRIKFQKARHENKVNAAVAAHAKQLEEWARLEEEHELALTGTMERLDAAIVRVPLVTGAKADVRSVKQVLNFAVDVMHGIEATASTFLAQAEKVNSLLPELAETVTQERALLQECAELVAGVAALQVEERSLRAHLIQLHQHQLTSKEKPNLDEHEHEHVLGGVEM